MQRIMNNPDDIVDEMLAGFVKCHSDIVKLVKTGEENPRGVVAAVDAPIADKVGIVTGGGSGHKPAFIGYVGKNMCDAAAVGEICSSPAALAFLEAFRAADGGRGTEGDRPLQKRWDRPDPMYSSRSGASELRDQRGNHGGRDRAPWGTGH